MTPNWEILLNPEASCCVFVHGYMIGELVVGGTPDSKKVDQEAYLTPFLGTKDLRHSLCVSL